MLRGPWRRSPASALLLCVALATFEGLPGPCAAPPAHAEESVRDKDFFDRGRAVWESFPREAVKGTRLPLEFRVGSGHFGPVLVVVYPDGTPKYLKPEFDTNRGYWRIEVPLDPRGGRHRVSLVVDSKAGDRMAAQFSLFATEKDGTRIDRDLDIPPEDAEYPHMDPGEHPLRLERILFHRMNAFRVASGLDPLPWHEGVARAAREHMPEMAQLYEDSYDARAGYGVLVHRFPEDGSNPEGPDIADRVRVSLAWPVVAPKLGPDDPARGRGAVNYISESLLKPDASLDRKFEQLMLRVSDHRAPMLQRDLTHAAGAAMWRTFLPKRRVRVVVGAKERRIEERPVTARTPAVEYGRTTNRAKNGPEEAFAILVYVQLNDPEVEKREVRQRAEVLAAPERAKDAAAKCEALRDVGRHAAAEAPRLLRGYLDDAHAGIRAAALDGLWLCDPGAARDHVDAVHVRVERAVAREEFAPVVADLEALAQVRYDAATAREGRLVLDTVRGRGRDALNAALMLARTDAAAGRAEVVRIARGWAGLPEGDDARDALGALPSAGEGK